MDIIDIVKKLEAQSMTKNFQTVHSHNLFTSIAEFQYGVINE